VALLAAAHIEIGGYLIPARIAPVATAAPAIPGTAVTAAAAAALAAMTAAATTAATAVFVPAAAATTAIPSATAAPFIAGPGFIHTQGASFNLLAVQLADGVLRIGFGSHGHKGESAGFAREFILHEQHFGYGASLRKHILQLELGGRERQVAYVQSVSHISKRSLNGSAVRFGGSDFRSRRLPVPRGTPSLKRLQ
jgi:hypothetical protein